MSDSSDPEWGCLAFILVCILLGGLGFCGTDCQNDLMGVVEKAGSAWRGQ